MRKSQKSSVTGGPYNGHYIAMTTLKFSVVHIREDICPRTGITLGMSRHYWRGRYVGGYWIGEVHAITKYQEDMTDLFKWRDIRTAPHNAEEVEVCMANGVIHPRAHFACDLSGEEQPAFRGWFIPSDSGGFVQIEKPKSWRPIQKEPVK